MPACSEGLTGGGLRDGVGFNHGGCSDGVSRRSSGEDVGDLHGGDAREEPKKGETTAIFVHDVDRTVEDEFSMAFLCRDYMTEQQGRLRHFTVPSHRNYNISDGTFCP